MGDLGTQTHLPINLILLEESYSSKNQPNQPLSQSMSDPKWTTLNGVRYPIDECGQLDESRSTQDKPSSSSHVMDFNCKDWKDVPEYTAKANPHGGPITFVPKLSKDEAATIIQKYARRIIVYQTVEFPVDLFIEAEYAITPEMFHEVA